MMKLPVLTLLLSISCIANGKPQLFSLKETESEALEALSRFFTPAKDSEKLNLPPVPVRNPFDRTYTHPYNFDLKNDGSGNYYFGFNTLAGLEQYEVGQLKNAGTHNEIQTVRGQYIDSYQTAGGTVIRRTIGYTADENGYQPFLKDIQVRPSSAGAPTLPGAPDGEKPSISSIVLQTLIGG